MHSGESEKAAVHWKDCHEEFYSFQEDLYGNPVTHVLEHALLRIASDPAINERFPETIFPGQLLREAAAHGRNEDFRQQREDALIQLYLTLHRLGSDYSSCEQQVLRERLGIRCLPGGLSPLVLVRHLLTDHSTSVDLGAGNGLQCLLLQSLHPHRKSIQVELSEFMISVGKMFAHALELGADRVEWLCSDIANAAFHEADVVYLYRPVKPYGSGRDLYRRISRTIETSQSIRYVISVADCLKGYLQGGQGRVSLAYENEYLRIFQSRGEGRAGDPPSRGWLSES